MDPVTHLMTGAALARAGFNRKAAYATLAMTLAAEAPDLDVLWRFRGPVAAFEHHRGWTHSLIGLPVLAAVVVAVIWAGDRLGAPFTTRFLRHEWDARKHHEGSPPVRWGLLYLFSLVALASHLLMDWTNNYGIRPLFPFHPRWIAGSFVAIFDPIIFLLLLMALVAPWLFGLVTSEIGARRQPFRGRGWATVALVGIVLMWTLRGWERQQALGIAASADSSGAQALRVWADPSMFSPFRWQTIVETPAAYRLATVNTLTGEFDSDAQADVFYKPPATLATLAARRSWLGQAYLDWSIFPLVTDTGADSDGVTQVTFRDLRFVRYVSGRMKRAPLAGVVYVDSDRRIVRMEMSGRVQR